MFFSNVFLDVFWVEFLKCDSGGEGGIRTLGKFPYTRVPGVHLKPLGHLTSKLFTDQKQR